MEIEETLPFPPPLQRRGTPTKLARAKVPRATPRRQQLAIVPAAPERAALSLEQLTESRLAELRTQNFLWETPPPPTAQEETPAQTSRQIVLASANPQPGALVQHSALQPLRWRGVPVTPEFQVYALRVARGEDLAPYRGQILADASLTFPWEAADVRALRKGTHGTVRSLLVLAAFAILAAFVLPSFESSAPELIAAPAPAPSEFSPPAPTVPGPLVLESAALPAAAVRPAAVPPTLASAPPKARVQARIPSAAPSAPLPPAGVAQLPSTLPNKQAAPPATAPASTEETGPSPLLVDRPTF